MRHNSYGISTGAILFGVMLTLSSAPALSFDKENHSDDDYSCSKTRGKHRRHNKNEEGGHMHRSFMNALEQLDLNDTQKVAIQSILNSAHTETMPIREQIKSKRQALHEELNKPQFSDKKVRKLARQQAGLIADKIVLLAKAAHQAKQELTYEQRTKLEEKTKKHRRH